ncbi:lipopolysaccharide-induced tumor necrosis factor-alpha factor homolog [Hyla sarda]|uniref:lipopolysaccharide-induced tumor necrosis factor-alpha factor homolog n=1 Tax=Hyla sarda TaxID=327740 RepID=UPI0024C35F03|nr:lipopolysaccharide-induced tumor necrosis factor-alpha factor homolog [Hyla sarda]
MFDQKIPSSANMDDENQAYQPPAITPYLSTPQYCLQPVPTMTHPQAISHIVTPCQPTVIYHLIAIVFLGLVAGCCLIHISMNATKDVDHFCPHSECHLFKYKRL